MKYFMILFILISSLCFNLWAQDQVSETEFPKGRVAATSEEPAQGLPIEPESSVSEAAPISIGHAPTSVCATCQTFGNTIRGDAPETLSSTIFPVSAEEKVNKGN